MRAYARDAIHVRHVDVHEHHIGCGLGDVAHHVAAIGPTTHETHVLRGVDEQLQPFAPLGIVIEDGYPQIPWGKAIALIAASGCHWFQ
jgi:hypothetical protein